MTESSLLRGHGEGKYLSEEMIDSLEQAPEG